MDSKQRLSCVDVYASLRQDNSRAKNLMNFKSDKAELPAIIQTLLLTSNQ